MRYDPASGRRVKVTADDPRYDEWPSRKPGKAQREYGKFAEAPLTYAGTKVARKIETQVGRTLQRLGRTALPTVGAAAVGASAGAAAILAAGYVVTDAIARNQRIKLGDRLNAISSRFVETQRQLIAAFRAGSWEGVPADVRKKAVADYKSAIARATAQAQGSALVGARAEGSYK